MHTALSLLTNNGFLAEAIVDYCHLHTIKYHLSYGPKEIRWEFGFHNTTDQEIVRKQFGEANFWKNG